MITNSKILITGGCGFIGRALIKKYYDDNEILVLSRDEAKHHALKQEFPRVEFRVCDIRNYDLMHRLTKGCDYGIFAASLKHIDVCSNNLEEAKSIILDGAINSKKVACDHGFKSAVFISSDKACSPALYYGVLKAAGEQVFVSSDITNGETVFSACRYGNVFNSTGSIVPLLEKYSGKKKFTLYHRDMTRFMIDAGEATHLIDACLVENVNRSIVVPDLQSFRLLDLFKIYEEDKGLEFEIGDRPREGEKIHESLISAEESYRTSYCFDRVLNYFKIGVNLSHFLPRGFLGKDLSSDSCLVTKKELRTIINEA